MQHDLHLIRIAEVLAQPADARLQQARQPIELAAVLAPALAFRPEHAAVKLVTNLHDIRQHPFRFKTGDSVAGIVMHPRFQLRKGQRLPGFGLELLAGIGPEIAVMDIQQQL